MRTRTNDNRLYLIVKSSYNQPDDCAICGKKVFLLEKSL